MELLRNSIFITSIIIYCIFAYMTIWFIPRNRFKKLAKLRSLDPELFLKKVDEYYKFTIDRTWKNCIRILKLSALKQVGKEAILDSMIQEINLKKISPSFILIYLTFILNILLFKEYDRFNLLMSKLNVIKINDLKNNIILDFIKIINYNVNNHYSNINALIDKANYFKFNHMDYYLSYAYYYLAESYSYIHDDRRSLYFYRECAKFDTRASGFAKNILKEGS